MTTLSTTQLLLIFFCRCTETARELCFKRGADGLSVSRALRQPFVWLGVFFWVVEVGAWVRVLESVPLTVAFPLMALVYVGTFFGGVVLLKESFSNRHLLGALLVTLGVAIVGSAGI